jgi:hypothetical protein
MTTIEIECASGSADFSAATKKATEVLRQSGIETRQRSRSLEKKGLAQVPDADAERALNLLAAANIRASVRPS